MVLSAACSRHRRSILRNSSDMLRDASSTKSGCRSNSILPRNQGTPYGGIAELADTCWSLRDDLNQAQVRQVDWRAGRNPALLSNRILVKGVLRRRCQFREGTERCRRKDSDVPAVFQTGWIQICRRPGALWSVRRPYRFRRKPPPIANRDVRERQAPWSCAQLARRCRGAGV